MEKARDDSFPYDAYKHIYLSYHLTMAFGPDFARELTDAHETIPNNTAAERKMDFINNEIGRNYALSGISPDYLLQRLLSDPQVIRDPAVVR
jgi:hypothetical protein